MGDRLIAAAREAQSAAYAPYSGYRVGAALETAAGQIFLGCNVENASYGLSICAERVALGAAVASGFREFRRLAVVTESDPPAPPCGACRQALFEFGGTLEITSAGPAGDRVWTLSELLPDPFSADDLSG